MNNKRILFILLSAALLCGCGSGPAGGESPAAVPEAAEEAAAVEAGNSEKVTFKVSGITIGYPSSFLDNTDKIQMYEESDYIESAGFCYTGLAFCPVTDTQAKGLDVLYFGVNGGRDESFLKEVLTPQAMPDRCVRLGTAGDFTFYRCEYDAVAEGIDEETAAIIRQIREELYAGEVGLAEPYMERVIAKGTKFAFESRDMDGNPVSSAELFSRNKVTMINIWTSWCIYCVKEMPELKIISEEYADRGVGLLGILFDSDEDGAMEKAAGILSENGVPYTNIQVTDEIKAQLTLRGYPTTIFVDSEGTVIAAPVEGASVEAYRQTLDSLTE